MTTIKYIARQQQVEDFESLLTNKREKIAYYQMTSTNYKSNKMPPQPPPLLLLPHLPSRPIGINRPAGASNDQHKTPLMQDSPSHKITTRLRTSQRIAARSSNKRETETSPRSESNSCLYNVSGHNTMLRRRQRHYYCMRPYQSQLVFLLALSIVSLAIVFDHLPGLQIMMNNKISANNNYSPLLKAQALQINWPSSSAATTTTNSHQQLPLSIPATATSTSATTANSATNINLQHQLLQVFNGNESQVAELNRFKIMEIYGDFLLIGAR